MVFNRKWITKILQAILVIILLQNACGNCSFLRKKNALADFETLDDREPTIDTGDSGARNAASHKQHRKLQARGTRKPRPQPTVLPTPAPSMNPTNQFSPTAVSTFSTVQVCIKQNGASIASSKTSICQARELLSAELDAVVTGLTENELASLYGISVRLVWHDAGCLVASNRPILYDEKVLNDRKVCLDIVARRHSGSYKTFVVDNYLI